MSKKKVDQMSPRNGKLYRNDGTVVNEAELLEAILAASGGAVARTVVVFSAADQAGNQTFTGYGTGKKVAIVNNSDESISFVAGGITTVIKPERGIDFDYADFTTCDVVASVGKTYDITISGVNA